jgi:hypothetical protein
MTATYISCDGKMWLAEVSGGSYSAVGQDERVGVRFTHQGSAETVVGRIHRVELDKQLTQERLCEVLREALADSGTR